MGQVGRYKRERDALKEQVARLERERDEAREDFTSLRDEKQAYYRHVAEQERDRLRAALEKDGRHDVDCWHLETNPGPCTCGLAEALEGKEPA